MGTVVTWHLLHNSLTCAWPSHNETATTTTCVHQTTNWNDALTPWFSWCRIPTCHCRDLLLACWLLLFLPLVPAYAHKATWLLHPVLPPCRSQSHTCPSSILPLFTFPPCHHAHPCSAFSDLLIYSQYTYTVPIHLLPHCRHNLSLIHIVEHQTLATLIKDTWMDHQRTCPVCFGEWATTI